MPYRTLLYLGYVNDCSSHEIMLIHEPTESIPQPARQSEDERESRCSSAQGSLMKNRACSTHNARWIRRWGPCLSALQAHFFPTTSWKQTLCLSRFRRMQIRSQVQVSRYQNYIHVHSFELLMWFTCCCFQTDTSLTSYKATFQLDGQQYETRGVVQKRVEADQIIYIWSSVSRLADNVILNEEGFTRIFRSNAPHCVSLESMSNASQLQAWRVAYMTQGASPLIGVATMSTAGKMFRAHSNKIASFIQDFMESMQIETKEELIKRVQSMCAVF